VKGPRCGQHLTSLDR